MLFAQYVQLSGNVVSIHSNDTIKYASVFESGSKTGTITNNRGFYTLLLKPGKQQLVIKESGFRIFKCDMVLQNDTVLNISLIPNSKKENIDDVVFMTIENENPPKNSRRKFLFF